jgi:hypothetical protein
MEVTMNKVGPLLALLLLLTACGGANPPSTAAQPTNSANASEPAGLAIPSIGVDVPNLDTFGLDDKGNYECPVDPQTAAWNRDGTVPGDPGLALIVAPAQGVFKRLGELKPGDPVYINQNGGRRITFKIVNATAKAGTAELQLASCGQGRTVALYAELTP